MKQRSHRLLAAALLFATSAFSVFAATYHVDSVGGDDLAAGTSPSAAWKTLARANAQSYQPGDQLLLKRGAVFPGHLHPSGNGTAGNPIRLGAYGTGNLPVIDGQGNFQSDTSARVVYSSNYGGSAVSFYNQEYWEISDIEVTNQGQDERIRRGLLVYFDLNGTYGSWKVTNCVFRGINGGDPSIGQAKSLGGIVFYRDNGPTFDGMLIEGNICRNITGNGIFIRHKNAGSNSVVIRNNINHNINGAPILVTTADNALIEHNLSYDINRPVGGVWNAYTKDAVFQYNEWYDGAAGQDGTAFDPDVFTERTIIQYNYVHDTAGGLVCFYSDYETEPDHIRYNVVVNVDGQTSGVVRWRFGHRAYIYNNTFYFNTFGTTNAFDGFELSSGRHRFFNNIVYIGPGATNFKYGKMKDGDAAWVSHNLYGGFHPASEPYKDTLHSFRADPLFFNTGATGNGFAAAANYMIQAGSPAIDAGKTFAHSATEDFFGNPLYTGLPDIGAHEYDPGAPSSYLVYEAETLPYTSGGAPTIVDANGEAIKLIADGVGDWLQFTLPEVPAGTYEVVVEYIRFANGGKAQATIGGTSVGPVFDSYNGGPDTSPINLGPVHVASTGDYDIRFTIAGKNSASTGHYIAINSITLVPASPAPPSMTLQAENLAYTAAGANTTIEGSGTWVKLQGNSIGDWIEFTLPDIPAGTYSLDVQIVKFANGGKAQITANGANVGSPFDWYNGGTTPNPFTAGSVSFGSTGNQTLRFTITGKDPASTSYNIALNSFTLTPL